MKINRKEFLRASAGAAGAALLTGCAESSGPGSVAAGSAIWAVPR